ncbi:hypothetical protein EV182_008766, partial [Spiromyces aspiralis]
DLTAVGQQQMYRIPVSAVALGETENQSVAEVWGPVEVDNGPTGIAARLGRRLDDPYQAIGNGWPKSSSSSTPLLNAPNGTYRPHVSVTGNVPPSSSGTSSNAAASEQQLTFNP